MADPDPFMARIEQATSHLHRGDRPAARQAFQDAWEALGPTGDPFHRCILAHYMADAQEDPQDELAWNLRALTAAQALTEAGVQAHQAAMSLAGFFPSLHLNLAADYQKLGDQAQACLQIQAARRFLDALPEDGYGRMIGAGIARLAAELGCDAEMS